MTSDVDDADWLIVLLACWSALNFCVVCALKRASAAWTTRFAVPLSLVCWAPKRLSLMADIVAWFDAYTEAL